MAYTLADYARTAASPLKAGVIDIMRANSAILEGLTFEDQGTLEIEALRYKSLPTVSSRKIGANWTESKGVVEPITERIVNIGGFTDIDKLLRKAKSIQDNKALQVEMWSKSITLYFNNIFFNGLPSVDYDSLIGLRYRLVNDMPAALSIDAGGLDISPDAAALAANIKTLIDKIMQLIEVVGYGGGGPSAGPDYLCMGLTLKLRLESALRQSGMLATTQDNYGRKFNTFGEGGPKIINPGTTDPLDLTTPILTDLEPNTGAAVSGGSFSSIFAYRTGGEYLNGFQVYALDVIDKGELESGVAERVIVDWPLGIYMTSPFSIGRIYDIQAS